MNALKIALAASAALSVAAPAFAQYQPTEQYQRQYDNYRADQAQYQDQQADYARARSDYEARRDRYERDRARYDARYGYGAYARIYGPAPTWDPNYYDNSASAYGRDASYVDPCRSTRSNGKVAGGVIGALAGAALGSNVAANGRGTEGAVLGAVVGGVAGATIGGSVAKTRCDEAGYYYNYADTMPYREGRYDRYARSGEYDYRYYSRQRCRLAAAPNDRYGDVRYVRVCPDGQGRYRITG